MKKVLSVVTAVLLCLALVACNAAPTPSEGGAQPKQSLDVYAIAGPTGVGLANLMKQDKDGASAVDYAFHLATAPDQVVAKMVNGETDIAAVPTNLASTLYNKTGGKVKVLALNTMGVLYVMQNGEATISSVADLRGKTIYSTGQGANPEYVLRYLLQRNGLDPDNDVTIKFLTENTELAAAVIKGDAEVALVPEPLATTIRSKKAAVKTVLNCTEEWNKVAEGGSTLTMGCVVVRTEVLEQKAQAVADFMREYQQSVNAALQDAAAAGALCAEFGILPDAALAAKAIPNCNLAFVQGAPMKLQLKGYLQVLFNANPKSVGGAMPKDDFYYNA